jgi:hypothetical protein
LLTFLFLLQDLWPTIPNSPQKMQWLARSLTGEDWREDAGEVIDCGIHLHLPETTDEPWSWEPSCTTARNAGSWLLVMPGHSYFHSSVESCLVLREQLSSAATKIHSMSFKMAVELREWFAVTRSTFYSWRRMKLQFTGWVLTPPNTDAWVFSLHLQAFPRIASCAWRLTVESKERNVGSSIIAFIYWCTILFGIPRFFSWVFAWCSGTTTVTWPTSAELAATFQEADEPTWRCLKNSSIGALGIYYLLSAFIFGIAGTLISVLTRIDLYSYRK